MLKNPKIMVRELGEKVGQCHSITTIYILTNYWADFLSDPEMGKCVGRRY